MIKSDHDWLEMVYIIILNVQYTSVYDITYFFEENTDYSISIHSELTTQWSRLSVDMSTSVNVLSYKTHVVYIGKLEPVIYDIAFVGQ